MTNTIRPIQRQTLRKAVEQLERKSNEVMTVTNAFDGFVESAWNVGEMGSKDLLALHDAIKKKPKSAGSYFLLHIKK